MTCPAGEAVNANTVSLLRRCFGGQVGIADSYATDEACRAIETTGRTRVGIDKFGILIDPYAIALVFPGKLCKHRATGVAIVLSTPAQKVGISVLVARKWIADGA